MIFGLLVFSYNYFVDSFGFLVLGTDEENYKTKTKN